MKNKLTDLLLQIIPVMIGVYLGFVVSNWGEQRQLQRQSQTLLENIESEIGLNREKLEAVVDYHRMLRDSSNHYAWIAKPVKQRPTYFKGTIMQPLLSSAYTTGVQTGLLNELPLATLQQLNQIYTFQENYNDFATLVLNGLIALDPGGDQNELGRIARFLGITMTDVVIMEEALIGMYGEVLEEM
jgi:hypothetical protein